MGDSARALLIGVETLLKATGSITALVATRVYAGPPADPTYPYILISCDSEPFAAADFAGMNHTLRVQAFSRENKPATVLAIREAVFNALNRQESSITVTGNTLVMIDHDGFAACFAQPDGRTYQSIIEFKAIVV